MESALIVSSTQKSISLLTEMLKEAAINNIIAVTSGGEARRTLTQRSFDLVIVNAPLKDESGEGLSRNIASDGTSQVILAVPNQYFDEVSTICENDGVLTIAKPLNKYVFWSILKLAKATEKRLMRIQNENSKLKRRIEDIRIVDRAKYILISCLNISENEAHKYIEKRSMDSRCTRRSIAEDIIREYESDNK